ncbi:MAG: hypothetical protein NVSMB33_08870 [Ktedonobacteraceae bacterium]
MDARSHELEELNPSYMTGVAAIGHVLDVAELTIKISLKMFIMSKIGILTSSLYVLIYGITDM